MTTALTTLTGKLAERFGMGDGADLTNTLKATCFKGQNQVTDAQMTMLLVVAQQHGLNPFTREIYAFPDKGGIVPVVGVDGWSRIINSHPQFDGMDFNFSEEMILMDGAGSHAPAWTECVIHRKDRGHPTVIREYLDEVYRAPFKSDKGYTVNGPWQSHPKRFSRHKAMIQCARIAFGFSGIYDQDEAERIVEVSGYVDASTGEIQQKPADRLPDYPQVEFNKNLPQWRAIVVSGRKTPDELIAMVEKKGVGAFTEAQRQSMHELAKHDDVTDVTPKGEPATPAMPTQGRHASLEQSEHDEFVAGMEG